MSIENNLQRIADSFESIAKSLAALTGDVKAIGAAPAEEPKKTVKKTEPKAETAPEPAPAEKTEAPAEEITLEQLRNVGIKIASNKAAVDDFKAVLAKFDIPKLTAAKPSDYAKIYPQLLEVCKKHNIA